ncbi:MAG: diguanylate cyclase [Deltaproteobacteria bacterium]|nr:diguanylate cyclase [Deltaproteobacteria bacterium]
MKTNSASYESMMRSFIEGARRALSIWLKATYPVPALAYSAHSGSPRTAAGTEHNELATATPICFRDAAAEEGGKQSNADLDPGLQDMAFQQTLIYARDLAKIYEEERTRRAELESALRMLRQEAEERERAQHELQQAEQRYRQLAENSFTGIYIHQDQRLVYVNARLARMGGYTREEMVGRMFWEFIHPEDWDMIELMDESRQKSTSLNTHYEFRFLCKDGTFKWAEALIGTVTYGDRKAAMGNIADITERKQAEIEREVLISQLRSARDALNWRANHDSLTGLLNRSAMIERLQQELVRADREGRPLAALMLDIDHFKQINDTYGHVGGDEALCGVATRIREAMRPYDLVARFGGEELLVAVPDCDSTHARSIAERIRRAICGTPFRSSKGPIKVTVSIGAASTETSAGEQDLNELITRADDALYEAKGSGRNCVRMGRRHYGKLVQSSAVIGDNYT